MVDLDVLFNGAQRLIADRRYEWQKGVGGVLEKQPGQVWRGKPEHLIALLRGRVFHVTNARGFKGISTAGKISANGDGRLPMNHTNSQVSYHRLRNEISVFDLRTPEQMKCALWDQCVSFFSPSYPDTSLFVFVLNEGSHCRLHHAPSTEQQCLPKRVEAGIPGEILLSEIDSVLEIEFRVSRGQPLAYPRQK